MAMTDFRIDNCITPIIQGNYAGVDVSGLLDFGNGENGINIYNAGVATVGGTTYSARNIASGNGQDGNLPARQLCGLHHQS